MQLDLNEMAWKCHQTAKDKGFWDHLTYTDGADGQNNNPSIWPEKIALIHSEASEMLDAMRHGDEAALTDECADVIIRVLDFAAARGINIHQAVTDKMSFNTRRPHLHGKVF